MPIPARRPPRPRTPRAAPAVAVPVALLAALCLGPGGCGNKGELYLPGPDGEAPIEPALPALEDALDVPPGETAAPRPVPGGGEDGDGDTGGDASAGGDGVDPEEGGRRGAARGSSGRPAADVGGAP